MFYSVPSFALVPTVPNFFFMPTLPLVVAAQGRE